MKFLQKFTRLKGRVESSAASQFSARIFALGATSIGLGLTAAITSTDTFARIIAEELDVSTVPQLTVSHGWLAVGMILLGVSCLALSFFIDLKSGARAKSINASRPKTKTVKSHV